MGKIFTNDNQLQEWVEAAEGIEDRFGIEKALGYVIGEKFYNLIKMVRFSRWKVRTIDEEKKKTGYTPIREHDYGDRKFIENLDETYEQEKEKIIEAVKLSDEFAALIKAAFDPQKIRQYLHSHPRLGALGHIVSEEEYDFMVSKGAVEHTLDTEVEDSLIFGEMLKYFQVR
jgi:hypothetical protein